MNLFFWRRSKRDDPYKSPQARDSFPGNDISQIEGIGPFKADHPVCPITLSRVKYVIEKLGYVIGTQAEDHIAGRWGETNFVFRVSDDGAWLGVSCLIPVSGGEGEMVEVMRRLHHAANAWNQSTHNPTAYVGQIDDQVGVQADSYFITAQGVNDNQLAYMIDLALSDGLQCVKELPSLVPPI